MTRSITILAAAFAGVLALATPVLADSMSASPPGGMMMKAKAPLIDINSAPKASLVALKGVGEKRADDIIKGRPYSGKDDLVSRKVIPEGVYDGIKDKIIAKQK